MMTSHYPNNNYQSTHVPSIHKITFFALILISFILLTTAKSTFPQNDPFTPLPDEDPVTNMNFYDDVIPYTIFPVKNDPQTTPLDCGESTAIIQRTLQLELLMRTNQQAILGSINEFNEKNDDFVNKFKNFDLASDQPLTHIWFASCNHQNRAQELWYQMYNKTGLNNVVNNNKNDQNSLSTKNSQISSIPTLDNGQLFLWLGDAIYLDRPPNPNSREPQSQRSDATRQLWRKHYCSVIRQRIPYNGMVDDHDFGLNNAGSSYSEKFRTKHLFLDFLDLPDAFELGASRQLGDLALGLCGVAVGCYVDDGKGGKIDQECKDKVVAIINDIHTLTLSNDYTALSTKYTGNILDNCYINYQSVLRYDGQIDSNFAKARNFITKKDAIFDSKINLSHISPQRSIFESYLSKSYVDRRNAHGTHSSSIYGPLFRRVKTVLIDVRVGQVHDLRVIFETHWHWVKQQLLSSVIPSVEEIYFSSNRRMVNSDEDIIQQAEVGIPDDSISQNEQDDQSEKKEKIAQTQNEKIAQTQNEKINQQNQASKSTQKAKVTQNSQDYDDFITILDRLHSTYSYYHPITGQLTLNRTLISEILSQESSQTNTSSSLSTSIQCKNDAFNLKDVLLLLTQWNNGSYLQNGADVVMIATGLLVVSWGKLQSEGWRRTPLERARLLELAGRMMSQSRQNVDEWKLYIEFRLMVCEGEEMPQIKFMSENQKNNKNTPFATQFNSYPTVSPFISQFSTQNIGQDNKEVVYKPLIEALKPVANVFLTGDIHFSEAAKSYYPIDLSYPSPTVVSNTKDVPVDTIYDNFEQEKVFLMTNDTTINGIFAKKNVEKYGEIIIDEIDDIIDKDYDISKVIKQDQERAQRWEKEKIMKKDNKIETQQVKNVEKNTQKSAQKIELLSTEVIQPKSKLMSKIYSFYSTVKSVLYSYSTGDAHNSASLQDDIIVLGKKVDENDEEIFPFPKPIMPSSLFTRYIAPMSDFTTSGITHGWGGSDPTATKKLASINAFFNLVLRPQVTNIDFVKKHTWFIDDLELYYNEINEGLSDDNGNNNNRNNQQQQQPLSPPLTITYSKDQFDMMRQQPRTFIMHNIADIYIDWDYDLIHINVKDKNIENVLYFSSKLDHHRAYTLPQLNGFGNVGVNDQGKVQNNVQNSQGGGVNVEQNRIKTEQKKDQNNNLVKNQEEKKKDKNNNIVDSKTVSQNYKKFLSDLQQQISAESGRRLRQPTTLTLTMITIMVIIFILLLIMSCVCCYRVAYVKGLRPLCCPRYNNKKVLEKENKKKIKQMKRVDTYDDDVDVDDDLTALVSNDTVDSNNNNNNNDGIGTDDVSKYSRLDDNIDTNNNNNNSNDKNNQSKNNQSKNNNSNNSSNLDGIELTSTGSVLVSSASSASSIKSKTSSNNNNNNNNSSSSNNKAITNNKNNNDINNNSSSSFNNNNKNVLPRDGL